jgi:glutaredoxin
MARHTVVAVLVTALAVSPAFAGKLYKWVNEAGNVSYQDRPPPVGQGRVEERDVHATGSIDADPAARAAAAKAPVTVYMVSGCSSCDAARAHLKQRGVPFREVNVSAGNASAQQEMIKKVGELSVPTITVGAKVMKGFLASLLDGELDAAGYPKSKLAEGEEEAETGSGAEAEAEPQPEIEDETEAEAEPAEDQTTDQ